jgi:dihydroorotate dehydrogenase
LNQESSYKRIIYPLLMRMDAESAHDRTVAALMRAQSRGPGRSILRRIAGSFPQQPIELFGLRFPNVVGVAAGFDKDVQAVEGLALLGFGHIEVGTITPQPQQGNEKPRVFRLIEDGAIINRMGFPSGGMAEARARLAALSRDRSYVIGVSLGKQKETSLVRAADDYVQVLQAVFPYADYLAVNISSPNTPELRELQGKKYLGDLVGAVADANREKAADLRLAPRPLLVKIAPDLADMELSDILQVITDNDIDGIIATNTTVGRDGLTDRNRKQLGGLSGRPLKAKSLEIIHFIARETGGHLPIIGVGGISSAVDIQERLDAGASLVQIYTALVYEGPGLVGRLLRELAITNGVVKV